MYFSKSLYFISNLNPSSKVTGSPVIASIQLPSKSLEYTCIYSSASCPSTPSGTSIVLAAYIIICEEMYGVFSVNKCVPITYIKSSFPVSAMFGFEGSNSAAYTLDVPSKATNKSNAKIYFICFLIFLLPFYKRFFS